MVVTEGNTHANGVKLINEYIYILKTDYLENKVNVFE